MVEHTRKQIERVRKALAISWSVKSSTKWSSENPANGQCSVSSLVVNDLLGGEILKTRVREGWHFYNRINGTRYDFTRSQFDEEIVLMDLLSSREEAFSDTSEAQYNYLRKHVFSLLDLNE